MLWAGHVIEASILGTFFSLGVSVPNLPVSNLRLSIEA